MRTVIRKVYQNGRVEHRVIQQEIRETIICTKESYSEAREVAIAICQPDEVISSDTVAGETFEDFNDQIEEAKNSKSAINQWLNSPNPYLEEN